MKAGLGFDSNTSGSLDKPLNRSSLKKHNINSFIAKLEFDIFKTNAFSP